MARAHPWNPALSVLSPCSQCLCGEISLVCAICGIRGRRGSSPRRHRGHRGQKESEEDRGGTVVRTAYRRLGRWPKPIPGTRRSRCCLRALSVSVVRSRLSVPCVESVDEQGLHHGGTEDAGKRGRGQRCWVFGVRCSVLGYRRRASVVSVRICEICGSKPVFTTEAQRTQRSEGEQRGQRRGRGSDCVQAPGPMPRAHPWNPALSVLSPCSQCLCGEISLVCAMCGICG